MRLRTFCRVISSRRALTASLLSQSGLKAIPHNTRLTRHLSLSLGCLPPAPLPSPLLCTRREQQAAGIAGNDIKKLQEGGFYTVEAIAYAPPTTRLSSTASAVVLFCNGHPHPRIHRHRHSPLACSRLRSTTHPLTHSCAHVCESQVCSYQEDHGNQRNQRAKGLCNCRHIHPITRIRSEPSSLPTVSTSLPPPPLPPPPPPPPPPPFQPSRDMLACNYSRFVCVFQLAARQCNSLLHRMQRRLPPPLEPPPPLDHWCFPLSMCSPPYHVFSPSPCVAESSYRSF
jgi:hypothetical protein